jgi:cyclic pyranopterin phosphate synthase
MVDVSEKSPTERVAVARGYVAMRPETLRRIVDRTIQKGDVLAVARVAGIMAAKRTPELIPLCHPIAISSVDIDLVARTEDSRVDITVTVRTTDRTGVEMEALTAVSVAGLTIYDMCKAVDREMVIGDVLLEEKRGGRSGTFRRRED